MMSLLQLHQVTKSFAETPAIQAINLSLDRGEILCLLGPSGCGKTTLLRLIAGLESPDTGQILCEGQDLVGIPPHQRDFGLMFQEFALFPHKNVGQNVAFGLQMKRTGEIGARINRMLELVGLAGLAERDVSNLSGGERQRVALARSLAPNPRLLMLDEPLGALDRALRERLMLEIRQILKQIELTAIYVTHDQTEAFAVADRIAVMNQGRIEQLGPPEQIYYQPATPFVARFLGFTNLLPGTWLARNKIETPLGIWSLPVKKPPPRGAVTVLIRPEAATLTSGDGIRLEGGVTGCLFRGRFYQMTIRIGACDLTFELSTPPLSQPGSRVTLWLNPEAISLFESP